MFCGLYLYKIINMLRRLTFSFLILLLSLHVQAIDAVVSHSVFYVPDPATAGKFIPELETYWQVNQRTVHYLTNTEKKIVGKLNTDFIIIGDNGIVKHDRFVLETTPRNNADELIKNSIIELKRYAVPEGMVRIKMIITDATDSKNKFVYSDSFMVYPHKAEAFYSDVEFLDTTIELPTETIFKKNGVQQVPNCSNFFDVQKKVLHYYAELYGTDIINKSDYPLIQKVYISRKENDPSYDGVIRTDTIAAGSTHTVSGSFPLSAQPSGNYYLIMSLENNTHQIIASRSMFFQRLNPHPDVPPQIQVKKAAAANDTGMENITLLDLNKTFLKKYDLQQVKSILRMLLPFSDYSATKTIEGFLKKPDDVYMRYYIYNYFAAINKENPTQAWKEFSEQIVEVNKLFTQHGIPGYQSDRGFMYLRYGAPTEVVTVENEQGSRPYEVWQYNMLTQTNKHQMANAVFLFYRPNNSMSDFKLLHCTVPGELKNGAWRSYLYQDASGGSNTNSRAEQYLGK